MSAVIMLISQLYFVRQLYIVKRLGTKWWIAVITFFAVIGFGGGVACVAVMYAFPHNVLANRNYYFSIFFGLAKGPGAVADILATTAMCMFLTSSRTGMTATNTLVTKLIRFIVHRGALVTLFQTALLLSFYAAPLHVYWMPLHLNVTKLYANTFFAMLNGRQHLKPNTEHSTSMSASSMTAFDASMVDSQVSTKPTATYKSAV